MKTLSRSILLTLSLLVLSACNSGGTAAPRAILGSSSAPVSLIEYSDFQCPACAAISPEIEAYARANLDKVRLEFRHFPLPQHANAFRAAVASECANLQGKFWEYATLNYQNQNNLTEDKLKEMAETLSLDTASFDACLDSNQTAGRVRDDLSSGQVLGVRFTPSIYANGKLIQYTTKEAFEGYIKSLK